MCFQALLGDGEGDAGNVALGDAAGRFGGEVAGGEAGAAGREDDVRHVAIAPGCELRGDALAVVGQDGADRHLVAFLDAAALDESATLVDARAAGDAVGDRQDRDSHHLDSLARPPERTGSR